MSVSKRDLLRQAASVAGLAHLPFGGVLRAGPAQAGPLRAGTGLETPPEIGSVSPQAKLGYIIARGYITESLLKKLTSAVVQLLDQDISDVKLIISSLGGDIEAAVETYRLLRSFPAKLSTYNLLEVESSATIVFLAGEERAAYPTARFLFHEQKYNSPVNLELKDMQERMAKAAYVRDLFHNIYKTRTRISDEMIARMQDTPVAFSAEDAVAVGIIGRVERLDIKSGVVLVLQ